jgi:conjugal transfer/entry exclusion protein
VEVLAHPADSALRAATAALDSASARLALARAALDSDAATLRDANRLDSAYARRYDAFETKRTSALALRDARDRARHTRDAIVARLTTSTTTKH